MATGPPPPNAAKQARKNSGRSLKAVPRETNSTGSSGGVHPPSSSRAEGDGPTNRYRSSNVSAPGWNSGGTKTTFKEAGASMPGRIWASSPYEVSSAFMSRTAARISGGGVPTRANAEERSLLANDGTSATSTAPVVAASTRPVMLIAS